jgi:hypothetical protein
MWHLLMMWLLLYFLIGWSLILGRHLPGESLMILLGCIGLGLWRVAILSKFHDLEMSGASWSKFGCCRMSINVSMLL